MDGVKKLKEIHLLNKVMDELAFETNLSKENEEEKNNLKILSKFIIHLCDESQNLKEFIKKLIDNQAEFSSQIINNLYNMIKSSRGVLNDIKSEKNEDEFNLDEFEEEMINEKKEEYIHSKFLTDIPIEEAEKKFSSLSIPNNNIKELDLKLGAAFGDDNNNNNDNKNNEENTEKNKIKTNLKISPIRYDDKDKNKYLKKRERSRSNSHEFNLSDKNNKYSKKDQNSKINNFEKDDNEKKKEIPKELVQNGIYDGIVTRVENYGCFVNLIIQNPKNLKNNKNSIQGFIHISQLKTFDYKTLNKINSAHDIVKVKDHIKVKVISLQNNKVTLSMNQVDQKTGEDLTIIHKERPSLFTEEKKSYQIDPNKKFGDLTGISLDTETKENENDLHSPEIWELNQMKNARAFNYSYEPNLKNQYLHNLNEENSSMEENIDVELKEEEPPFLKGQTSKAGINFSPVRIVKNPDGVLHKAAMQQAEEARNRREQKELEKKQSNLKNDNNNNFSNNIQFLNNNIDNNNIKILPGNTSTQQYQFLQPKKFLATSRSFMSIKEQRESLPIFQLKQELKEAVNKNRIIIVIGETGSGKTTQITQYLVEWNYAKFGKIGCTQPRRVAAQSVARRVSEEFGCKLGEYVGYSVRFDDCCSEDTIIKYMTDGMLLREALIDKNLTGYSVIMLDEAHERTIHTDILFGLLKDAMESRNDLKLIVTSATLDSEKFSKFFNDCPVFNIPGRTFDVEIFYSKEPEYNYMEAALNTVMQIHLNEKPGDILVFLTGQEEIDTACQILENRINETPNQKDKKLIILPVYSALPSELQSKIFDPVPFNHRKCVIATNIAEASLTIDGIYYVVDSGFAKIKAYNPKLGMDSLIIAPISQSSAMQRAGRAGRTGPGKCYRLYTYDSYNNEMLKATVPEIQRTNLANTVLLLKALGINDLIHFHFMDPPPLQTLIVSMEQLYYLGALDDEGLLTKLGRRMAEFPLEPQLSKMLLTSVDLGCSEEIITIVSMLSVQNIFYRPRDKQQEADLKKSKFLHREGDHLSLLKVYEMFQKNHSPQWCSDNYIHYRALRKAEDIKRQLNTIMERYKLPIISSKGDTGKVRKAITAGFFFHVARKDPNEGYRTLIDNHIIFIHPSSALFNKTPEWVVYHELVMTSKEYMREITVINPKWLVDVAAKFFRKCNPNELSKRQRMEKIQPLQNKYEDPNAWRLSKRRGIIY